MKTKFLATLGGTACLVALALATLSPAGAQLVCQYGILDLTANGGINPNTGVDCKPATHTASPSIRWA